MDQREEGKHLSLDLFLSHIGRATANCLLFNLHRKINLFILYGQLSSEYFCNDVFGWWWPALCLCQQDLHPKIASLGRNWKLQPSGWFDSCFGGLIYSYSARFHICSSFQLTEPLWQKNRWRPLLTISGLTCHPTNPINFVMIEQTIFDLSSNLCYYARHLFAHWVLSFRSFCGT